MQGRTGKGALRRVDVQVSVFTIIIVTVICVIIAASYYNITHNDMVRSLEDRVYAIHDYITKHGDDAVFRDINTPADMDTELYREAHETYSRAYELTGVMYLYSAKRSETGELVYLVDCISPDSPDFCRPGDPIEPEIAPELSRALEGEDVLPRRIKNTDWGKIYIAYLPVVSEGEVLGAIGIEFEAQHQYETYYTLRVMTPIAAAIICFISSLVAGRIFRRISNPLYKDMVNTDYLTNLKSRNAFEVDIENLAAERRREGTGFCVIDMNNLKRVNDTLGHEKGDVYLQSAAHSFRATAGRNVTIYRTGGDEFVLLTQGESLAGMEELCRRLAENFERDKPDWGIDLSFSAGIALYDPALDSSLTATFRRADGNMYENKRKFHAEAAVSETGESVLS